MRPDGRVTLVATAATKPDLDWSAATTRLAFAGSITAVRFALQSAVSDVGLDVERIVVDRAAGPEEFLELLSHVPLEFTGDLMLVRDDGGGYISATGRGGNRVLYALEASDVRFYLDTHDLVTGRVAACRERLSA